MGGGGKKMATVPGMTGIMMGSSGETERGRSPSGVSPSGASASGPPAPDPEVRAKPARRRFSAQYKLRILEAADLCQKPGELGALLRGEGLYSSHLNFWRKQRTQGILAGLKPSKRGRKPIGRNPLSDRVAQLERENHRLRDRLDKAETIIEVQKKVAALLASPEPENKD